MRASQEVGRQEAGDQGEGSAAPPWGRTGVCRAEADYPRSTTTTTITAPIASTTRRLRRRVVRPTLRWNLTSGVRCGVVLIIIMLRLRSHGAAFAFAQE